MTMVKGVSDVLEAASDRLGQATRSCVADVLQQLGLEDALAQHLMQSLDPAVSDVVSQVQSSFKHGVASRVLVALRKGGASGEAEDVTGAGDTDSLINLCVPQTVLQDINGPQGQSGMSQIFRDTPFQPPQPQQQQGQNNTPYANGNANAGNSPSNTPVGASMSPPPGPNSAGSVASSNGPAAGMGAPMFSSPAPGTPVQMPSSASPYAAPNSPLLADLYNQLGNGQQGQANGLTSMPSLGMGMGLGLDFGSLQLRDPSANNGNGLLGGQGNGPAMTSAMLSSALDNQAVSLMLQQQAQHQHQQAQQQQAQHALVGGAPAFARMSDTGSHTSTTSHTSYGEALRSLVSPHDPVFVPHDHVTQQAHQLLQHHHHQQQAALGLFNSLAQSTASTTISSNSPTMSTASPLSISPSQTFSPSRPLNMSNNASTTSLQSNGSNAMASASLPMLMSSQMMMAGLDPITMGLHSDALAAMDPATMNLAMQAAALRAAGRPPAVPRGAANAAAVAKAASLVKSMGMGMMPPAGGLPGMPPRPIEVPGRFKALPPAVQAKIINICQTNPVVSVKDFDEKVVSKLSMLVEGWGADEALSMLGHLEQRMRSKQGTMKNGPGYLDVAVCTHIDMLKAQGACPKTMKIEEYAKHCLSAQVFNELRDAVAANRWLQWDHFDQGIIQLIKKLPHDSAVEKLQEMSYHSFKNVDNIKGCIMSILNSKIREDRRNRCAAGMQV